MESSENERTEIGFAIPRLTAGRKRSKLGQVSLCNEQTGHDRPRTASVQRLFVFAPLLTILFSVPPATAAEAGAEKPPLWRDPAQPLESRVRDLVGRMTLEEKARQVCNVAPAIPRLGLPAYDYWNEALHGIGRNGIATVFPQAIGMAASFDPALLHTVADAIATEGRAKNREYTEAHHGDSTNYSGLSFWTPNINIFRDPRWGRGTGDLRGGHFSDGANGGGLHPGIAGGRSEVRQGHGLRQTFRRPQRAGN